jgi:hypothetical protein
LETLKKVISRENIPFNTTVREISWEERPLHACKTSNYLLLETLKKEISRESIPLNTTLREMSWEERQLESFMFNITFRPK